MRIEDLPGAQSKSPDKEAYIYGAIAAACVLIALYVSSVFAIAAIPASGKAILLTHNKQFDRTYAIPRLRVALYTILLVAIAVLALN